MQQILFYSNWETKNEFGHYVLYLVCALILFFFAGAYAAQVQVLI